MFTGDGDGGDLCRLGGALQQGAKGEAVEELADLERLFHTDSSRGPRSDPRTFAQRGGRVDV